MDHVLRAFQAVIERRCAPWPLPSRNTASQRPAHDSLSCERAGGRRADHLRHGWPELSLSWRHQLPVFGGLGFRAMAPDMRGYGRSRVYPRHEDYALEHVAAGMVELLDHLGAAKAMWVGHDWGGPVVWTMAQQHPGRCMAWPTSASLPAGRLRRREHDPLVDRSVYPEEQYPAAQWDYRLHYRENFAAAQAEMEADPHATVRALFRGGSPSRMGQPAVTAAVRAIGGWFCPGKRAPDLPLDTRVLSPEDAEAYGEALVRNGFFGPNSWYMNAQGTWPMRSA